MSFLAEKTVLVTGSSRGIGAETARHLAAQGMRVAVTYSRSADRARSLFEALPGSGHLLVPLDVSSDESISTCFETIAKEFGGLYGLVNNAGITRDQILLRMKPDDFDLVIRTNLRGTFFCCKLAVKMMVKARLGSIVNITSVVGQSGQGGQANYAASKAGVEAFGKSLAQEVGSRHIRVNSIAPGFIETDMTGELSEAQKKAILDKVPMGSLGQPIDVAHTASFLLSDQAKYITGQTIAVNGGMYM